MKRSLVLLVALAVLYAGCSRNEATSSSASPSPSLSPSPSASAAAVAEASPTSVGTSPTATPDILADVQYTDINGSVAETQIKQLALIGVFSPKTGAFHPDAPVTRAQYIAWLVAANNLYQKDNAAGQIRLAGSSSDQTFVDVPKSNPFFPQIEGVADAGFVIGIDKNHFAPDRNLTREELVAIQTVRYMGGAALGKMDSANAMYCVSLTDKDQISKPYWAAFNTDQCTGFSGQNEVHRIFGAVRTLHPQRPVTRAEVAIALTKIANTTIDKVLPH